MPHKPTTPRTCQQCGIEFLVEPFVVRAGRGKYCSITCRGKSRRKNIEMELLNYVVNERGCFIYQGHTDKAGYAVMDTIYEGTARRVRLSRVILQRVYSVPMEQRHMFACHKCDTPSCINPDCIFPGTSMENKADCVQKQRHCFGERNRHAKLTEAQVMEIRNLRANGVSAPVLAAQFGVNRDNIWGIVTGRLWKHLPLVA